jgi:hypothetical protein
VFARDRREEDLGGLKVGSRSGGEGRDRKVELAHPRGVSVIAPTRLAVPAGPFERGDDLQVRFLVPEVLVENAQVVTDGCILVAGLE